MPIAILTGTLVWSKAHFLVFPVKYSVESQHHITAYNSPWVGNDACIVMPGVGLPYILTLVSRLDAKRKEVTWRASDVSSCNFSTGA